MNVYLESSAALRVILGGAEADEIDRMTRNASLVVTSGLTLAEIARVMTRLRVLDPVTAAAAASRESALVTLSETWVVKAVDDVLLARCGRAFPREPVRTLDAVHLATIELASSVLSPLVVVSTDSRVRENAVALGFEVRPS